MEWFKNLKKWQKGALIGCAVGLILACIIILSPQRHSLGEWIDNFHGVLYILPVYLSFFLYGEPGGTAFEYGGAVFIVIFYGGLGAVFGRFQQITKPFWKWLLTALLVLFLLLFYVMNYNFPLF